jgi:hypothetical protein
MKPRAVVVSSLRANKPTPRRTSTSTVAGDDKWRMSRVSANLAVFCFVLAMCEECTCDFLGCERSARKNWSSEYRVIHPLVDNPPRKSWSWKSREREREEKITTMTCEPTSRTMPRRRRAAVFVTFVFLLFAAASTTATEGNYQIPLFNYPLHIQCQKVSKWPSVLGSSALMTHWNALVPVFSQFLKGKCILSKI